MNMLPPTIDELRADYGPSSPPKITSGVAYAGHYLVETGKGDRVEHVDRRDARIANLTGQLEHFVNKWAETDGNNAELAGTIRALRGDKTVLKAQVDRQAETIKRLTAQVDVLRAQNRSLTDKLLGLEGKRPPPGGALDDPKTSILFGEPLVPRHKEAGQWPVRW